MWIVKGALLGGLLFVVGTIICVIVMIQLSSAPATGLTAIEAWTVQNPLYWIAFVLALVIGCVIVRWRTAPKVG